VDRLGAIDYQGFTKRVMAPSFIGEIQDSSPELTSQVVGCSVGLLS